MFWQNVAALLTVGGWTGSKYFSTAVGSAENRTQFAQALVKLVDEYDLDGIDIECVLCPLDSFRLFTDLPVGSIPISKAPDVMSYLTKTHQTFSRSSGNCAPLIRERT